MGHTENKLDLGADIIIPNEVKQIIDRLKYNGYEAYAVGGCVRDTLMGREPEDWDITTSASPEQVKDLFSRTIDTGIQHGTVTVMFGDTGYEVTTYRIDGSYEDHRHPGEVQFTTSLIEDLKRRDFTINAMAYSPGIGIIDDFNGKEDLEGKVIRAVGNAKERFSEDALRMLRAIRFAGQLHFRIERETREGILELASTIIHVSAERIRIELMKLLISDGSECFYLIKKLGLSNVFLPEWKGDKHSLEVVKEVNHLCMKRKVLLKQQKALVFAALLHDDVDAEQTQQICKRLTFDNETVKTVERLIRFHKKGFKQYGAKYKHDIEIKTNYIEMRFVMHEIGSDLLPLLFLLQEADLVAKYRGRESDVENQQKKELEEAKRLFEEICNRKEPITMKDLLINGGDLKQAGIQSGPQMGKLLEYLLEEVLFNPENNNKEKLMTLAQQRAAFEQWEGEEKCH